MTVETYELIAGGILTMFSAALVCIRLTNKSSDVTLIQNLKEVVSFILRVKK